MPTEHSTSAMMVGFPDLNATLRTKSYPADRIGDRPRPTTFSDIVFALDVVDALIPRPFEYQGWWPDWSQGFGDLLAVPDPSTERPVPWWSNSRLMFADLCHRDGSPVAVAPRQILAGLVARCAQQGLHVTIGPEIEFFLPDDDQPPGLGAGKAYAAFPGELAASVVQQSTAWLADAHIDIYSWYVEGGPSQQEITLCPTDPLTAADHILLTRAALREAARRHGGRAWFMAKPSAGYGNGLHMHLSLHDKHGKNLLAGTESGPHPGGTGAACLAGILNLLPEATALLTPTVNAFKRLAPYTAAGTTSTWAPDNRGCGIRYIFSGDDSRIELRAAAGDANPYLAVAATLAGILHGIEHPYELPPPAQDAYRTGTPLPTDLTSATTLLDSSKALRLHLGDALIHHYAATRRWEAAEFAATVTEWELRRYADL